MSNPSVPFRARRTRLVRRLAVDLIVYVLLLIGLLSVILPFIYMVASSFENQIQISALTPQFWPNPFTWENYQRVWNDLPMARFFLNSVIVSVTITLGQ